MDHIELIDRSLFSRNSVRTRYDAVCDGDSTEARHLEVPSAAHTCIARRWATDAGELVVLEALAPFRLKFE